MITLCKKFPVIYNGKKYYAKLFKYDWQKYNNECRTRIYKRVLFFNIRLHEEGCSYSTELKDNDYQYFVGWIEFECFPKEILNIPKFLHSFFS